MRVAAPDVIPRLQALLGADAVITEATGPWAVEGMVPRAAVRPADAAQTAAVLRVCSEAGAAVVPWGGGTAVEVGNPPRAVEVVLLTDRLSRVVEHDHSNLTVTVEAGITLGALEAALAAHGQFLPLEPPHAEAATAGGAIATALSGPRRMAYGAPRDLVIGIRAALPQGTVIRWGGKTVKNVAGYDMGKLFVGSLGTLGVITELTFKVSPLPETSKTIVVWGGDLLSLAEFAGRIAASPLQPTAITVLNRAGAAALGRDPALLLVRAEGVEAATARHERDLTAWAAGARYDAETLTGWAEAATWRTVRDLGWRGEQVTMRIAVPAGRTAVLLDRLRQVLSPSWGIAAHMAAGTVWIAADGDRLVPSALASVRDLASSLGGHFLLARGPRTFKEGADVWAPAPEARVLELMRGLKQAFDPQSTLNPGRYIAGL
ncbi:MAG: FAD-binding oxidoreductase [Armatimonadota bacterium]|nr:FAD-binding oxidoreductase [Armatimonadota bacterium]